MDQSTISAIDQHGTAADADTVRPAPAVAEGLVLDAPPVMTAEELAHAAAELAALVEHHRQELIDTMAELTRLQRVLRAETRAAIQAIQAATDPSVAAATDPATER